MREYCTIQAEAVTAELIIEKSRFIACAKRVESVEEANAFIAERKKKYYDATHNCYAYIIGDKAKFSDDGEPQGTAGLPMYECIKNNHLDFVCVVVTRYFGGIKLGAGGLVRAYSGGVSEVLKACRRVEMRSCVRAEVTCDYTLYQSLRRALTSRCVIEQVDFSDRVALSILCLADLSNTIADIVTQTSNGRAIFKEKESVLFDYPQQNG